MVNKVICVCTKDDGYVFEIASTYIQRNIIAKRYVAIVPEIELEFFRSLDLGEFEIISEEKYSGIANYLQSKKIKNRDRFGWYFQQFIKLSELDEGNKRDINVIWDADTIPIKEINFLSNEKINFYQGKEYHLPYFQLVHRLLGLNKISKHSFIAQCFPCRVEWFDEFKSAVQQRSGKIWYEEIIDLIDFSQISGFSEYETLGTYILSNFSDEVTINNTTNNWYRNGAALIGSAQHIEKYRRYLQRNFDFISIEKWDKKPLSFIKRFKIICFGLDYLK
ncbi:MAG: hypothetical protein HKM28_05805 [Flavobacteriaceae bacterium]|nr:hypothetical protein [Flavobacteriaceae bacterium]